jgi:biopolymer transport protein ExbD
MSKKPQTEHEVSPNLIPMVDIMFLLLLFFMLGADMGHRELEVVKLPLASTVKEDKDDSDIETRLTINVFHLYPPEVVCGAYDRGEICREKKHWRIAMKGTQYVEQTLNLLVKKLQRHADTEGHDPTRPKISEKKLMVRADASAPYGLVQMVLRSAVKAGMYKIECGAARPTPE